MTRIPKHSIAPVALALALLSAAAARPAAAQSCTPITSVPYTISASGRYCLTGSLYTGQTSGDAITVAASYVTIDLGGYELVAGYAPASTAYGIHSWALSDITVKNGTIRGFAWGISLDGQQTNTYSKNHLVENVRVIGASYNAIRVIGQSNIVRNNEVLLTGGGTAQGTSPTYAGIAVHGSRNVVEKNEVAGFVSYGTSTFLGIVMNPGSNSLVEGNRIMEASTGIYIGSAAAANVVGNRIFQGTWGVYYALSSGRYRDNLTIGVANPYSGGTDAGNNQ